VPNFSSYLRRHSRGQFQPGLVGNQRVGEKQGGAGFMRTPMRYGREMRQMAAGMRTQEVRARTLLGR
jgi:hypothetical protein